MTMQDDQQMIKKIAAGGAFDPVEAIRTLARTIAANAPAKEAPAAVMDAEQTPAKKRPAKDTMAQE